MARGVRFEVVAAVVRGGELRRDLRVAEGFVEIDDRVESSARSEPLVDPLSRTLCA